MDRNSLSEQEKEVVLAALGCWETKLGRELGEPGVSVSGQLRIKLEIEKVRSIAKRLEL